MREILFRGKTYGGEWVQGDLFEVFDDGFFIHDKRCHSVKIIPETVGQYTGLTDKYGKKIFEGDIIKWGLKPCVIKWDECNASFCLYAYGTVKISGFNRDTMKLKEVIGNIHDNPELMKGAE